MVDMYHRNLTKRILHANSSIDEDDLTAVKIRIYLT